MNKLKKVRKKKITIKYLLAYEIKWMRKTVKKNIIANNDLADGIIAGFLNDKRRDFDSRVKKIKCR